MPLGSDARAGVAAVAPMLLGVIPFGLVAGASPVAEGLGAWAAVGLSSIVFAGASQLAVVDALAGGGSALVAILAACTINLRMVLYSAALAPYLSHEPVRRRLHAAYLLTDQAFALSIARWPADRERSGRITYYLAAGWVLWGTWQGSTIVGALAGGAVPDDVPLDFAIPLVFLVLLVPVLSGRPSLVAAAAGGAGAVGAAQAGAGPLSVMVGAVAGIAAGVVADLVFDRSARS